MHVLVHSVPPVGVVQLDVLQIVHVDVKEQEDVNVQQIVLVLLMIQEMVKMIAMMKQLQILDLE